MPKDFDPRNVPGLKLGADAVDFELPGIDGKTYALGDFADKPVLVVAWWCNHCPYVQAWEQRAIDLAKAYAGKGVQFVMINSNETENYPEDDFPTMQARAKEYGYPFPYLRDETQEAVGKYGAVATPDFFVFDRNRKLVYRGRLDDNHRDPGAVSKRYLKDALDAILAGSPPPSPVTAPYGCSIKWVT